MHPTSTHKATNILTISIGILLSAALFDSAVQYYTNGFQEELWVPIIVSFMLTVTLLLTPNHPIIRFGALLRNSIFSNSVFEKGKDSNRVFQDKELLRLEKVLLTLPKVNSRVFIDLEFPAKTKTNYIDYLIGQTKKLDVRTKKKLEILKTIIEDNENRINIQASDYQRKLGRGPRTISDILTGNDASTKKFLTPPKN